MLQGRVAPPPSPATPFVTPTAKQSNTVSFATGSRPQPLSRRNSFSRDTAASIAQLRSRPLEENSQNIHLHVRDATTALSPRRSSSFTHPRSQSLILRDVAMNALTMAATASSNEGCGIVPRLRPTQSDLHIKTNEINHDPEQSGVHVAVSAVAQSSDHPSYSHSLEADASPSNSDPPSHSPPKHGDDEIEVEIDGEGYDDPESLISSSYSPVSPTRDEDESFEAWLQVKDPPLEDLDDSPCMADVPPPPTDEATTSSTPPSRIDSFTREINGWLLRKSSSTLELSKTVQQIEYDIRHAFDSAASRVNAELQRRDHFQQELREAASAVSSAVTPPQTSLLTHSEIQPIPTEPELLLLMEVLIGKGRSETIEIHVGDRPEELAIAFAHKHGLVIDAVPRLTQHIQDQLAALENEEEMRDTQASTDHGLSNGTGLSDDEKDERVTADYNWIADDIYDPDASDTLPPPPPSPVSALTNNDEINESAINVLTPPQRDYEREHKYNTLMEKYGHYTSQSGRIDTSTTHRSSSVASHATSTASDDHELARIVFTRRSRPGAGRSKENTVYDRLYALAEHKEKWIRRQQKLKAQEAVKERGAMKLDISVRSRELVAHRTNNGYAHIGERLYEEALVDIARKDRASERRAEEREAEVDWTCPKCAFVNHHRDEVCKNIVASPPSLNSSGGTMGSSSMNSVRRDSVAAVLYENPEVLCGHGRPEILFRPTLLAPSAPVARALSMHKQRTGNVTTQRRQKNQQSIEEAFRQTYPFRPTINELSIEIMREKLENETKAATAAGSDQQLRRKDPYQALYEDAFHSKAQKQAREQEYLSQFPFKPNIGVNALWMTGNERTLSTQDVVERLTVSNYQELERKRMSLHEKYAPDKDPHTGKEYFKPEIGRAPIFNRNERNLPIGDFLYESHREQAEYHRRLRQQDTDAIKQQSQQCFLSETSKQALETRKTRTYTRVFDTLVRVSQPGTTDTLNEGKKDDVEQRVVPSQVQLDQLPLEIRRVASIVFEFANHEPFTRQEFDGYMEKLVTEVPGLTHTQMLFLAEHLHDGKSSRRSTEKPPPKEDFNGQEYTFHPTIDKNSAALAQKHGRVDQAKVFEALNQYYEHYQKRKMMVKKEQDRQFARTHPFQPTFVTKDRASKAATFYNKLQRSDPIKPPHPSQSTDPSVHVSTSSLRTAVVNARPSVRPIDPHSSRKPSRILSKGDHAKPLTALEDQPSSQRQSRSPPKSTKTAFSPTKIMHSLDAIDNCSGNVTFHVNHN